MDLQKNSIDLFLQSVCRFVWDDEKQGIFKMN